MAHIGRNLLLALAAGAAGGAAATLLNQRNGQNRALAKSAVRAGLLAYDRLRGAMGEAAETMSDVMAEVRSEVETERSAPPHAGADAQDRGAQGQNAREHVAPFGVKTEAERTVHG